MEYPTATLIRNLVVSHLISSSELNIFETIDHWIATFDQYFLNDPDWINKDAPDLKDSLRAQVLQLLGLDDF